MTALHSTPPAGTVETLPNRRQIGRQQWQWRLPCITSRRRIRLLATAAFVAGFAGTGHADEIVQGPDEVVVSDEWIVDDTLVVGQDQDGTLRIQGNVQSHDTILGGDAGVMGTVVVSGPEAVWRGATLDGDAIHIGHDGKGVLEIENGGYVVFEAEKNVDIGWGEGAEGEVSVIGEDSRLEAARGINIGISADSTGQLEILDGGKVSSRGSSIGYGTGGSGTVIVSGEGSVWEVTEGALYVGRRGDGELKITGGGQVNVSNNDVSIVRYEGASGAVTVLGSGSLLSASRDIFVGQSGSGTLDVFDGGQVSASVDVTIGMFAGVSSATTVSGTGSLLSAGDDLYVGSGGDGTLDIIAGGEVSVGDLVSIGYDGASGIVGVSGVDSFLSVDGELHLGEGGHGTLDIADGGWVVVDEDAWVGGKEASAGERFGAVKVSGISSEDGEEAVLQVWGSLYIGGVGQGTLDVTDGGEVRVDYDVSIGVGEGASGTVTVSGVNSEWGSRSEFSVEEYLYVGDRGAGALRVDGGGGLWIREDMLIGRWETGSGDVEVDGDDSLLSVAGVLHVGSGGAGTLVIRENGLVVVGDEDGDRYGDGGGDVEIASGDGSSGVLAIGALAGEDATVAGTLEAAHLNFGDGTGTLVLNHTSATTFEAALASIATGTNWTHALEHYAGDTTLTGDSSGFAGTTTVSGGSLTVAEDAALGGSASVTGGALIVNGTIGGPIDVASGAMLGGAGVIGGDVTVETGATLAPGALTGAMGTLTVAGNLTVAQGSTLDFGFGTPGYSTEPGESDSVHVQGNLTLEGTMLNLSDAGGLGLGVYRLFEYGGTLTETNGGIMLGTIPASVQSEWLTIQRVTDEKHIDLVNTAGQPLNFWNANGKASPTQRGGGSGVWSNSNEVWADATGHVTGAMQPQPGFAIFAGEAGMVTVDDVDGAVLTTGMQFAADGYRMTGGVLTLVADTNHPAPVEIRVGVDAGSRDWVATIENVIAGTDGLRKTGAGTLVLTASNTYTGGTEIVGGVLSVSSDANLGDAGGALTFNGGILRVTGDSFTSTARDIVWGANGGGFDIASAGNTFTVFQSLDAGGSLRKQGDGTLVLTGANSYTGGTLVEAGTLIGNVASIRGDIGNAGTVVFDQATDATFDGDIAGFGSIDGQMVKQGAGDLTLAGISRLDWTIEAGGLTTAADRFSGDVAIAAPASFTFDQSADAVYAGALSGTGSFLKQGSGVLAYDGDGSAFTGSTTVEQGALIVGSSEAHADAVLGGAVEILSGATLGGHGTVGSVTLDAGATIAPGNSVGTITVVGDITFDVGSTYMVEVDPEGTESDLIHVTGKATLGGASVVHIGEIGTYRPTTTYTILTADGGIASTFDTVTSSFAFLDPELSYDAQNVYLRLTRNGIDFCLAGMTANQCAAGTGVESTDAGNSIYDAVVGLSADQATDAFDQLSGEVHASLKGMLIDDSRFVRDAATDRIRSAFAAVGSDTMPVLAYGPDGTGPVPASADTLASAAWGRAFGSWSELDSDGNAAALSWSTGGFLTGLDAAFGDHWRAGIITGYSHTSFDVDDRASSGSADSFHLGLYGGGEWDVAGGTLGLRGGAAYSWHDIETERSIAFGSFSDSPTGDYHAGTAQVFGEIGYGFEAGAFGLEPFANLAYVRLETDGFTEDGGAAALTSASTSTGVTFTTLGLHAATGFTFNGVKATARGMIGWRHASGDVTALSSFVFVGGDAFTIAGVPIAEDAALLEAGLDFDLSPSATLGLSYQGQFASNTSQNTLNATLRVAF